MSPSSGGYLPSTDARRIYFDRDDQPDDLFGARRPPMRCGDQDVSEGPFWRIVYWTRPALRSGIRLVVVLAIGRGHARQPAESAYEAALRRLEPLVKASPRERRTK
ncbi:MAG: hypothetical protein WBP81_06600 [Solirubrobacteraceae bacterium]